MATTKSIVRSDSLSVDRIIGSYDEDYVACPICTNILWKPIACKTCENAFCLKCIRLWLKEQPGVCPFKCTFEERKAPPILIKLLSKLSLECSNKSKGCTLSIPYEALENHELQECLYTLSKCTNCGEEMLKKDFDVHQREQCLIEGTTCLKCGTTYKPSEGHSKSECLQIQAITIREKLDTSSEALPRIEDNYNRLIKQCERLEDNKNYAKKAQVSRQDSIWVPSAPIYEPPSPAPTRPHDPLRLSTIDFTRIPRAVEQGGHVPNGYAGFDWENAYYMSENCAKSNFYLRGFLSTFSESRKCVAYNGKREALSMSLSDPSKTFGLHSFEAILVYHENLKFSITAYRSDAILGTKHITLNSSQVSLVEIDWENIDKVVFTPQRNQFRLQPETFALISLNLLL